MNRRSALLLLSAAAPTPAVAELEKSGPMVFHGRDLPVKITLDGLGTLHILPDVTALESAHIAVLLAAAMISKKADLQYYVEQHSLERFFHN